MRDVGKEEIKMKNKTQREKNLHYANRKRIIERTIDLIQFGYENEFISKRTGLEKNRVNCIREIMEEDK